MFILNFNSKNFESLIKIIWWNWFWISRAHSTIVFQSINSYINKPFDCIAFLFLLRTECSEFIRYQRGFLLLFLVHFVDYRLECFDIYVCVCPWIFYMDACVYVYACDCVLVHHCYLLVQFLYFKCIAQTIFIVLQFVDFCRFDVHSYNIN